MTGINGWTVTLLAITGTLVSLLLGSWCGVGIGLLISTAGLMELKGRKMLKAGRLAEAVKWLSTSQLWLLSVIIGYCAYQMFSFNPTDILQTISLEQLHMIEENFKLPHQTITNLVTKTYYVFYLALIIISLLYQGGLWLFYRTSICNFLTDNKSQNNKHKAKIGMNKDMKLAQNAYQNLKKSP